MTAQPFSLSTLLVATVACSLLAQRSLRKRTLTRSGAGAGFMMGFLLLATGYRGGVLFYFYMVGTWATKYKLSRKMQLDGSLQQGSIRGARQVLSVSAIAVLLSLYHAIRCGEERPIDFAVNTQSNLASHLTCAILAHHATSLADTLASELGILSPSPPILIIRPWQTVPAGTNGGITFFGTLCSGIGGGIIGLCYVLTDYCNGTGPVRPLATILYGVLCGLIGSVLDSVIGATLQATYYHTKERKVYHTRALRSLAPTQNDGNQDITMIHVAGIDILSNEQVNLVSLIICTILGGWVLGPWVFLSLPY